MSQSQVAGTVTSVAVAYLLTTPTGIDWHTCSVECHATLEAIIPPAWAAPPRRVPVLTLWECVHCAGCGLLLATPPADCMWHVKECPGVNLLLTVPITRAARGLMRAGGVCPLPELAVVLLEEASTRVPDGRWQVWADSVWQDRAMWLP